MPSSEHAPSRKRKATLCSHRASSVSGATNTDPAAPPRPKIARPSTAANGPKLSKFSKGEIVYYCKNGLRTRSTVLTVYTHDPSGAFYDIRLEGEEGDGGGGRVKQTIEEYLCKLSESHEQELGQQATTTTTVNAPEATTNNTTRVTGSQLQRRETERKDKHKKKKKNEKEKEKEKEKEEGEREKKKENKQKQKKKKKKKQKKRENEDAGDGQAKSSSSDDRRGDHFAHDRSERSDRSTRKKKARETPQGRRRVSGSSDVFDLGQEGDERRRRKVVKAKKDRKKKKKKSKNKKKNKEHRRTSQ